MHTSELSVRTHPCAKTENFHMVNITHENLSSLASQPKYTIDSVKVIFANCEKTVRYS